MRKELTFVNATILLFAVFFSAILISMNVNYWAVVDFFALPSADTDMLLMPDSIDFTYFLFLQYVDNIKFTVLDFFIKVYGYDLRLTIYFVVLVILFIAIVKYFFVSGLFELISILLCVTALLLSVLIVSNVSKESVDNAFIKYAFKDRVITDYRKLLIDRDFEKLDNVLKHIQVGFVNGSINVNEYDFQFTKFAKTAGSHVDALNDWVKGSGFPEIALAARAATFYHLGWKARGAAFSSKTSKEQFEGMKKYFDLAAEDIKQSMRINDDILYAYIVQIGIANVNKSDSEAEKIFMAARKRFPDSYYLAYSYMDKIQPKWGGTLSQMRNIAHSYTGYFSDNPLLVALTGLELMAIADSEYRNKDYLAAIKVYKRSLLYGLRRGVIKNIYYAYKEIKDYEMAAATMTLCLDNYKDNGDCYFYRAQIYTLNSEWNKAKQDLARAIESGLDRALQYQNIGWMYEKMESNSQAGKYYMLASDMDYMNIYSLKRIYALAFYHHITVEEALPYMKRWTEVEPDKSGPWLKYANTLEDIKPLESIPLYKKYLSIVDHNNENNKRSIKYALKKIADHTAN